LVVAEWRSKAEHGSYPGVLCGGGVGMLLDCHSAWTARWVVRQHTAAERAPMMVTDEDSVKFFRPAPLGTPIRIVGRRIHVTERRAIIDSSFERDNIVYAVFRGTFAAWLRPEPPRASG